MSAEIVVPIGKPVNGVQYYGAMLLPSDEQLRDELDRIVDAWTTPTQKLQNAWRRAHQKECRRCRGRGYRRDTPDRRCIPCAGTGYVAREESRAAA